MLCSLYFNRLLRRFSPPSQSGTSAVDLDARSQGVFFRGPFVASARRWGTSLFCSRGLRVLESRWWISIVHTQLNPWSGPSTYTRAVSFRRMSQCRLCPPVALQARSCTMMGERPLLPQSAALHLVSKEYRVVLGRRRRAARSICAERPSRPGFAVASTWVIVRGPFAVFVLCGRLDSGSSC